MMSIESLQATARVAWLNAYTIAKTNPFYPAVQFVQPLSVIVIMFLYTGASHLAYLFAGAALFQAINAGVLVFSDSAANKLYFKMQDLFVASPTKPIVYALSRGFSNLMLNGPAAIFYLALAVISSKAGLAAFAISLAAMSILVLTLSSIAFFAAMYVAGDQEVFMLGNLLSFFLFLLSPVYYPITALPEFAQYMAFLFPATGPGLMVQWSLGLTALSTTMLALAAANIIVYCFAAFWCLKNAPWREK